MNSKVGGRLSLAACSFLALASSLCVLDDASGQIGVLSPQVYGVKTLSTPTPNRQFRISITGRGFNQATIRVIVVGPGCSVIGQCIVPRSVLKDVSGTSIGEVPLTLNEGSYRIYVQNGTGYRSYTSAGVTVPKATASNNSADPCSQYYGKGYCTDYITSRVGTKPSGHAKDWPANVTDKYSVRRGDAAIFRGVPSHGHVAYVERVNNDRNGKAESVDISEWNWHQEYRDRNCAVTRNFGIRTDRYKISISNVSGFWRPSSAALLNRIGSIVNGGDRGSETRPTDGDKRSAPEPADKSGSKNEQKPSLKERLKRTLLDILKPRQ